MNYENTDLQAILDAEDEYLTGPFDDDFADEDWIEISAARQRAMLVPDWVAQELENDLMEQD